MNNLAGLRLQLADTLRHDRRLRTWMGRATALSVRKHGNLTTAQAVESVNKLCQAARLAPTASAMQAVERAIEACLPSIRPQELDWPRVLKPFRRDRMEKAVILKAPVGPRERGVLFVSFEYQWGRLLVLPNLEELAQRYQLVTAPCWSPPHTLINSLFPALYPDKKIVSLISNEDDLVIFPRLSPKNHMVRLFASSWVNPDLYQPVPFEKKDIDIFMLANFGVYKRHFALFRALRELPAHIRVRLIGQTSDNRTVETLLREANVYGVGGRFEIIENASDATVYESFSRAKISLILSRQEGSCVAVVESMFANTPVGIYHDAIIGSRVFVNEHTGRFLDHHHLGRDLAEFLASAERYTPRRWVLENHVDCFGSTNTLNGVLRDLALNAGEEWTTDIAPHHWRPDPVLVREQDRQRLEPETLEFQKRFGFALGRPG